MRPGKSLHYVTHFWKCPENFSWYRNVLNLQLTLLEHDVNLISQNSSDCWSWAYVPAACAVSTRNWTRTSGTPLHIVNWWDAQVWPDCQHEKTQQCISTWMMLEARELVVVIKTVEPNERYKESWSADTIPVPTEPGSPRKQYAHRTWKENFRCTRTSCCVLSRDYNDMLYFEKGVCGTMTKTSVAYWSSWVRYCMYEHALPPE